VTRSRSQASALSGRLAQAGATPIEVPVIDFAPPGDGGAALRDAFSRLAEYRWVVFTSANTVRRCRALLGAAARGEVKVAAIGEGTAAALTEVGTGVDLVPERYVAESLVEAFPPADGPARVLLPRAAVARDTLPDGLSEKGWLVDVVEAYRTVPVELDEAALELLAQAHAMTFTSSSTVTAFVSSAGRGRVPPVVACIGPVTARTAVEAGLHVDVEAGTHSINGLVSALVAWARANGLPDRRR
jgi:uroporphyrinogen-III synthase